MPSTFITGIAGQDGSYLAELLVGKGYDVYGLVADNQSSLENIISIKDKVHLIYGDITDHKLITETINRLKPDEIYNLASQSHVGLSWQKPIETFDQTATSAINIFEAVRLYSPQSKVFQASSSETLNPSNPYAVAKSAADQIARIYCQSYKLFISSGILYNHESPRRQTDMVTRKITLAVAKIKKQIDEKMTPDKLELGNLDTARDWGYAPDYVEAMWQILQLPTPDQYTIAAGQIHTLREFCRVAFSHVGLNWQDHVIVNPQFFRPIDTPAQAGDYSKLNNATGWKPTIKFEDMVKLMVSSDLDKINI